jgi:uncharacterized protein (DUF58 family)
LSAIPASDLVTRATMYPTRWAIVGMLAGGPISLLLGIFAPGLWLLGIAWIALWGALLLADALIGADGRGVTSNLSVPRVISINGAGAARATVVFPRSAPRTVEIALEAGARIAPAQRISAAVRAGVAETEFALRPLRRGREDLGRVWARWTGPLGLMWKQVVSNTDLAVTITPDIEGVKEEAVRLFARESAHGLKIQLEAGEGADFHALREFQPGMDIRTIDWKRSATHGGLLAKEYRVERNNPVILAIDSGRSMVEPIAGLARIDWALNAALLLGFVSLKVGDRVGLYSFDARPGRMSGPVSGIRAFSALQRAAGGIDYSAEETNCAYGLASLADHLERRSLVVVFTEFTDPTSAELMVDTVGALLSRHLVLFVVMRDEELEDLIGAEPRLADDVTRSVIAGSLLRERDLVVARLRRLGVEIVDARARDIGPALLDRYLELKRRSRV